MQAQLIVVGQADQIYTFSKLVEYATYEADYIIQMLEDSPDFIMDTDTILEMFVVPGDFFQHFWNKKIEGKHAGHTFGQPGVQRSK